MAEFTNANTVSVAAGQNVPLTETAVAGKGCVVHREGAGIVTLRGNYGRGSSYARRGSHYVRGHYSMDDGRDSLISRMEDIMRGADSKDREVIQRCIDTMRNG